MRLAGASAPAWAPSSAPAHRERVSGWDLLRGLCALAVMAYHLLGWQDIVHLSPLGTYGVYLFFTLSGASLGYAYPASAVATPGAVARFLAVRWFRLAPLYILACGVFLAMLAARLGHWADLLPLRLALNATFAFGLSDPSVWALAVGGWSLGVEFVFYLLFPFLARAAASRKGGRAASSSAKRLAASSWAASAAPSPRATKPSQRLRCPARVTSHSPGASARPSSSSTQWTRARRAASSAAG